MEANKNDKRQNIEEINLIDIFMTLWRHKIFIICIALILGVLGGLYSKFMISPVFHSSMNVAINMPESYHTKYGDYILPLTNNQQYIKLMNSNNILINSLKALDEKADETHIKSLNDSINIVSTNTSSTEEQNSFIIRVAANSAEKAMNRAQALYENYTEYIDVITMDSAIDYYISDYSTKIKNLKDELEINTELLEMDKKLLAETPKTINQKDAMQEIQKDNVNDFIILENIINPNYTQIEADIIDNTQRINLTQNTILLYDKYLIELGKIRNNLTMYYETGELEGLKSDMVSITESSVYLTSAPLLPIEKTGPSNMKNAILGAFIGGMIGVLIALIRGFWVKKHK